jgi:hypothetical protein
MAQPARECFTPNAFTVIESKNASSNMWLAYVPFA